MEWLQIAWALGLPWLVGTLWLRGLWRNAPTGIVSLSLGYGYLLGLLLTALLIRAQTMLGLGLNFIFPLSLLSILALGGGFFLWWRQHGTAFKSRQKKCCAMPIPFWQQIVFLLLLLWIVWRITGLIQEIELRPLYPWDAWTTWMARARVWASLQELVPFVGAVQWLNADSTAVYTIPAWYYPDAVSLIALWPTLILGAWNETAANLPWLGAFLALGLGFYGQSRIWGAGPLVALGFTWMLLSLPMLNAHVALAGYADLWLTAVLGLAVCAFFQWARTGDHWQGLLVFLLALACPWIKREGLVWILLFLPAAIIVAIPTGYRLTLSLFAVAVIFIGYMAGGFSVTLSGLGTYALTPQTIELPWLGHFDLQYHDVWEPLLRNLFILGNWHLFFYLFLLAILLAIPQIFSSPWQLAGTIWIISGLVALLILFFYTEAYLWVEQYTSVNRLIMHFVPAWLFWSMTVLLPLFATPSLQSASDACKAGE